MPGTRGVVPVPLENHNRDLTQEILEKLDRQGSFASNDEFPDIPQGQIKAALDRLGSRQMIQYKTNDSERIILTAEGQMICDEGSHEYKVWDAVRRHKKLEMKDLAVSPINSPM